MTPGAAGATLAWLAVSMPAWQRFRRALMQPQAAQMQVLRRQLAAGRSSAYGRHYGLDAVEDYEAFRRRVPIVSYDDLAPWVRRIAGGESAVLTTDRVTRLVPTSGSTGGRKLIPFTAALQREFNAAIGPWMIDLALRHPEIVGGPAYWSVSPAIVVPPPEGVVVPVGFDDDAAYLGGMRQRIVDSAMAVPAWVREVTDPTLFRRVVLLHLLQCADLRLISVWHPSYLALLLDALPALWDSLLTDLDSGEFAGTRLPESLRARLVALPARRRRVAQLRRTSPNQIATIWPRLRVISCWGDGNAQFALDDLARRLPKASIQPKGLLSTEAFVTIPFGGGHPLAVVSHFFEFIADTGEVLCAHELRVGLTYEVVVTTSGGLWRYRTADRVEVAGFIERTPSLRFLGRTGCVSDRCGEKLSEAFVAEALRRAVGSSKNAIRFALLAPEEISAAQWSYVLFVEGAPPAELLPRLELALRENPHYAYCRDIGQLQPLRVVKVSANAYERFAAAETARGLKLGDIKPVALSLRSDWRMVFG
jgi:hypothetical protein